MKKSIFLLALPLVLSFQKRNPDATQGNVSYIKTLFEQGKINGRVNAITEIELTPKTDGTKTDSMIKKTKFDIKGNTTLETYTSIDHVAPNVDVFDPRTGDKINKKRLKNTSIFKYNTIYDRNRGKRISCNAYGTKEVYLFDKDGILTESNKYQTDGQLTDKDVYKYDDKNRLIEINVYTEKDSLYEQDIYKYKDKNLVAEKSVFYDENRIQNHLLQMQYIYDYVSFDRLGNWIKRKQKEIESGNRVERIVTDKIVIRKITYY